MGTIRLKNVSFAYEDLAGAAVTKDRQLALENVSLQIPDGQFLCLIGHSGSGKSTLLRLLLGLSKPTSGCVLIDGEPVSGPGLNRSFVLQNYSLFPWMKVRENVEFGIEQANKELSRGMSKRDIAEAATLYLSRVSMLEAQDRYPYQLSGGMRQRVAIARALAIDAEILIFDEPFGALDVKTRCSLQKLVDSLWRDGGHRVLHHQLEHLRQLRRRHRGHHRVRNRGDRALRRHLLAPAPLHHLAIAVPASAAYLE